MEFIGELGIPKIEMESMDYRHSFQTRSFLRHDQFVREDEYGKAVVKRLTDDPRVMSLEGQMVSGGSGAVRFDVGVLAIWFVWCANCFGEKIAHEHLENWLNSDEVDVINTLWVLGIDPGSTIELSDGYVVQSILEMPDSDEKEYFLQQKFGIFSRQNFPKCAITKEIRIKKIAAGAPGGNLNGNGFATSSRKLHDIALVLNSLNGVTCVPYFQTSYRPSTTPIGHFGGSGGGMPMYDVSTSTLSSISAAAGPTIDLLYSSYEDKSESEKARLQLILGRLSQAKRRMQIEDRILDLGIALEMLLLEENEKDQLSLQFRIRGSWLLGQSFEDRLVKSKLLNEIYDTRSSVAHSGALHRTKPQKLAIVRENLGKYVELAEATIQKIIIEGPPSWDNIMLKGAATEPKPS